MALLNLLRTYYGLQFLLSDMIKPYPCHIFGSFFCFFLLKMPHCLIVLGGCFIHIASGKYFIFFHQRWSIEGVPMWKILEWFMIIIVRVDIEVKKLDHVYIYI